MDLSCWGKLFEPDGNYCSETALQRLWKKELWKKFYRGLGGEEVQILDPGHHNPVQGPDFRHARLYIDGRLVNGDVELHFDNMDWYHHGHHTNPEYNSVVLHVVFRNTDGSSYVTTARRQRVPNLLIPLADLPSGFSEDCPVRIKPDAAIIEELCRAGRKRCLEKAGFFYARRRRFSFDLVFFWGLFKVCGYRYNTRNFIALFLSLPWDKIFDGSIPSADLEAILFYYSGIRQNPPDGQMLKYEELVRHSGIQVQGNASHRLEWSYSRSRPGNFPDRRIAWLAAMIRTYRGMDTRSWLLGDWSDFTKADARLKDLFEAGPYDAYWMRRYRLGGKEGRPLSLTPGRSVRREFLLNVLAPLMKAEAMAERENEEVLNTANEMAGLTETIRTDSLYLDVEKFFRHHEVRVNEKARGWLVSQGVLYCREHYCNLRLHALCPVCSPPHQDLKLS